VDYIMTHGFVIDEKENFPYHLTVVQQNF
jgi:hypothetical protein